MTRPALHGTVGHAPGWRASWRGKHGNLKLKHGSSDTSFERAHLVELNATNRISKGLSNQKWRVITNNKRAILVLKKDFDSIKIGKLLGKIEAEALVFIDHVSDMLSQMELDDAVALSFLDGNVLFSLRSFAPSKQDRNGPDDTVHSLRLLSWFFACVCTLSLATPRPFSVLLTPIE
ncbi:hypothetical protein J6590_037275 [Homalodisca vitripennis]|nr:hypothetical protein J6590_037275 [Homalodisca vitripennis]